jgi:hypothetical protein
MESIILCRAEFARRYASQARAFHKKAAFIGNHLRRPAGRPYRAVRKRGGSDPAACRDRKEYRRRRAYARRSGGFICQHPSKPEPPGLPALTDSVQKVLDGPVSGGIPSTLEEKAWRRPGAKSLVVEEPSCEAVIRRSSMSGSRRLFHQAIPYRAAVLAGHGGWPHADRRSNP